MSRTCWTRSSPASASASRAPLFHVKRLVNHPARPLIPAAGAVRVRRETPEIHPDVRMPSSTSSLSAAAMPAARLRRPRPAWARARRWSRTRFATIGEMSCNPAIGGLGKGHLVREIDALDGLMGRVADAAGIQFRLLNRSKGPAVQGPRAQADRKLYRQAMQAAIRATANLEVIEGGGRGPDRRERPRWPGSSPATAARSRAGAVVLTTGTFLRGLIHRGEEKIPAGRSRRGPRQRPVGAPAGARAATRAASRPARRRASTAARSTGRAWRCSPATTRRCRSRSSPSGSPRRRSPAASPRTTEATHAIIRANLHRAPMYSGQIDSVGPRYCPSIEDKVVRFAGRAGAPDLPGARGPRRRHGLSQRRLHLAAGRGAGGLPAHHSGPGEGGDPAARLRHRVRLRRPARALPDAGGEAPAGPVPGRPDQRHHRLRGGRRPGPGGRHQCRPEGRRRQPRSSWSPAPTATSA